MKLVNLNLAPHRKKFTPFILNYIFCTILIIFYTCTKPVGIEHANALKFKPFKTLILQI